MLLYTWFFVTLLMYGECDDNIKINSYELPCSTYIGDCMMEKDCPLDQRTPTKGLCPTQQQYGVECCYKYNDPVSKCYQKGGECIPKYSRCPDFLTVKGIGICYDDQLCCVFT